jgi:hypothetical protein
MTSPIVNRSILFPILAACSALAGAPAVWAESQGSQYLKDARQLHAAGQYFKAARYAFAAGEAEPSISAEADSQATLSLLRANLPNAASYFFIRTLQSGDKAAIRRVTGQTQELLLAVGGDLLRKYLIRHTHYDDYDALNRSAYLYSLGKDALLSGHEEQAIGYFNGISGQSPLYAPSLQLRGSAFAIQGKTQEAINDFDACQSRVESAARTGRESSDLKARCLAGEARTLYQMDRFDEADQVYDLIPKASLVWPDILFEQAWNSFGRREYNRTLGKLVSYKSPALAFVFNTEVDVLRAQTYLAMCLFDDANEVINEFNGKYTRVGEAVKNFVESHANDLNAFYRLGKDSLRGSLYTQNETHRMVNRFIRGPYFQNLVAAERAIGLEAAAARQFGAMQKGADNTPGRGFPGFIEQVLGWRGKTVRQLGGAFVKNSLIDYHTILISDFEKMAFIKLEMLKQAKDKLVYKGIKNATPKDSGERMRGDIEPSRRDYQYFWSFNGEFWNDELGDYVFGLKSECGKGDEERG